MEITPVISNSMTVEELLTKMDEDIKAIKDDMKNHLSKKVEGVSAQARSVLDP